VEILLVGGLNQVLLRFGAGEDQIGHGGAIEKGQSVGPAGLAGGVDGAVEHGFDPNHEGARRNLTLLLGEMRRSA
jgi:hypothetical protein